MNCHRFEYKIEKIFNLPATERQCLHWFGWIFDKFDLIPPFHLQNICKCLIILPTPFELTDLSETMLPDLQTQMIVYNHCKIYLVATYVIQE